MNSVITLEEALKKVSESPKITEDDISIQKKLNELDDKSRIERQKIKEAEEIQKMRMHWSIFLMFCIGIVLIFDILLIFFLGLDWVSFESNYTVPFFITDGLIKIIGLAVIVVKFLFNNENTLNHKKQ